MGKTISWSGLLAVGLGNLLFTAMATAAPSFIATVTAVKGDAKVFRVFADSLEKSPAVQYRGKVYVEYKVKLGFKVSANDVLHCGPDAKIKVTYSNGDQFIIGPGSSLQLPNVMVEKNDAKKDADKEKKKLQGPVLNIFYGKIRSMISKQGALNNMRVRTRSAVAGVRGTDFYVKDDGVDGTRLTVLRGRVAVRKAPVKDEVNALPPKVELVQSGYSATVGTEDTNKSEAVKIYEAPKQELHSIQQASFIKVEAASASEEVKKEIADLQIKAKEAVMDDIKVEDQVLYEKMQKDQTTSVEEINTAVVSKVFNKAPGPDPRQKVKPKDLEDLGEDVYNKYFKIEK